MPPASIRTRLTLWYTSVLLGILVVITSFSYWLMAWALTQDVDRSLLSVAHIIRDSVGSGGGAEGAPIDLETEFRDQLFQVLDAGGVASYRSPRLAADALPVSATARSAARSGKPVFETRRLERDPVRVVTLPVVHGRRPIEFVEVAGSLARSHRTLARYLESLVVLVPLGLGLAASGGALMARKALGPVDDISRLARRIRAEDLNRRVPVRGTGDELDRLAETLNEMLERLGGAFAEMRRFSADAAHELRTPLTVLKGGLEVALRAERSSAEYRQVLAASLEEVDRLVRLAEDLLMVARAQAQLEPTRAPVDLEQVALDVLDVGARLAQARGVIVRMEVGEPVRVLGDVAALRRAALNLVENAVKFTPAGGLVELDVGRTDSSGLLSVRDTGPGVSSADVERVFEPFVRLDAARNRESGGTGLGLSIARSIVTAHGGTLTVESAGGHGSRFTIRLPTIA